TKVLFSHVLGGIERDIEIRTQLRCALAIERMTHEAVSDEAGKSRLNIFVLRLWHDLGKQTGEIGFYFEYRQLRRPHFPGDIRLFRFLPDQVKRSRRRLLTRLEGSPFSLGILERNEGNGFLRIGVQQVTLVEGAGKAIEAVENDGCTCGHFDSA